MRTLILAALAALPLAACQVASPEWGSREEYSLLLSARSSDIGICYALPGDTRTLRLYRQAQKFVMDHPSRTRSEPMIGSFSDGTFYGQANSAIASYTFIAHFNEKGELEGTLKANGCDLTAKATAAKAQRAGIN